MDKNSPLSWSSLPEQRFSMSASQLTPRATSAALLPEKSLPRPPPLPSSVASTSYATNTLKALPARPAFGRSVTEAESKSRRLPKTSLWFSETNDNTAGSSLSIDSETPKRSLFAPSAACATTTMASPPHQHQPNDCKYWKEIVGPIISGTDFLYRLSYLLIVSVHSCPSSYDLETRRECLSY